MKKIPVLLLFMIVSFNAFNQQTTAPTQPLTKTDYLQKSKNQKTAAWILLVGGTALAAGSIMWATQNLNSTGSGPIGLIVAGGVSMLGSIPLFIASGKNKRKAMSMSFKMQPVPQLQKNSLVNRQAPSLSLKINL